MSIRNDVTFQSLPPAASLSAAPPAAIPHGTISLTRLLGLLVATLAIGCGVGAASEHTHDVVIRHALIYDGTGARPYPGVLAIDSDRISYVGPRRTLKGHLEIDAHGQAVAPGFIDMMGHSEVSLLIDGRAMSGLKQGVTLDVFTESTMGPLSPEMAKQMAAEQGDLKFDVTWSTLGQYLDHLEQKGITPNVASFVGEGEVRAYVLGEADVAPTPEQLVTMQGLVHQAMEEGAMGLTTALIYAPNVYAKTPELIALASESARCGGIYTAHMRSEGDHIEDALQETIDIARASGAPAEVHHLKLIGQSNWGKLDKIVAMINAARSSGTRITADMYTYTAGGTSLDASLPPWVHDGGVAAMISRLQDPVIRAKVIAAMREDHPKDWENLYRQSGPDGMLLMVVKHAALKPLIGMTIAEIAKSRGVSPEEAIIEIVVEDEAAAGAAYTIMSEDNLPREMVLPWVSSGSDAEASAPEGAFLLSSTHPRAYGNFARIFAKYVREEHVLTVEEAVRKITSLPADVLSLSDRGRLRAGAYADIVIFDPATIQDHSTYAKPMQYATGVTDVFINGKLALKDGEPTGATSGRILRGRAWTGRPGGGCRASSQDWSWIDQPPAR
jgi:N-acyl-D-amino-acid deacylase